MKQPSAINKTIKKIFFKWQFITASEALTSIKNEICLVKMIIYLNFPGLTPGFQIV